MPASSVTGSGLGVAGPKAETQSNVKNVFFADVNSDLQHIGTNVNVVFVTLNGGDFKLYIPPAKEMVGKFIHFRSKTGGNMSLLSDGESWEVASWYNND